MKSLDPLRHVSLQLKVLDFYGLSFRIPYSKKSLYFWLAILSRICTGVLIFFLPTATQIMYLVRLVLDGKADLHSIVAGIGLIMAELMTEFKLLNMRLRRSQLEHLFDQFTNKEFLHDLDTHRIISERAVRISRWLFVGILCVGVTDIIVHIFVVPGLDDFQYLPIKMDFIFFDVNDPRYFGVVYIFQIMFKPCMIGMFCLLLSLPWAAMSFTIGQLNILIYKFENMEDTVKETKMKTGCDENEAFSQIFKECILHHSAIKRFINSMESTFSLQLALSLSLNAAIIGTSAIHLLSIKSNAVEVFWVSVFMALFIGMLFGDCYFGNAITVKCEDLSTKVYECPWVNLNIKLKKDVLLFLISTQRPVIIFAAKVTPVSMETFTKVMNWVYKGFAVLNQTDI